MKDLMTNSKYQEYQNFINNYSYPEFTNEDSHRHHIIPMCVGGSNDKSNLILLTVSDHQKAHELLANLATDEYKQKLTYAYVQFTNAYNKAINPIIDDDYEDIYPYNKSQYSERFKNFSMIGQLRMKNARKVYMDLIDRLTQVSKSALILFNEIKENTDPRTCISVMEKFSEASANQRREINRRLAELREVDLVIKLRKIEDLPPLIEDMKGMILVPEKFSYMINPYLIKPKNYNINETNYERAKELWKILKN